MERIEHKPATIFTVDNFLSKEECATQIAWSESKGYKQAKISMMGRQVIANDVRNNSRVLFKDEVLAASMFERIKPFCMQKFGFMEAFGLNELFRFYKYTRGQKFKAHFDGSYERNESERSLYTLMIYLNDNFAGGNTWFEDLEIKPKAGTALIFKHDLLHEGMEVLSGEKYVLRTDIMYRLNTAK